jgi:hypothetical protein
MWLGQQIHCAPPELEALCTDWSYRHLAALRLGTNCSENSRVRTTTVNTKTIGEDK